mgnify:CR=1 FL=1
MKGVAKNDIIVKDDFVRFFHWANINICIYIYIYINTRIRIWIVFQLEANAYIGVPLLERSLNFGLH